MFTVTDCGIIIIINIHISNDYSLTRFPKYYVYESKFNSQKCNTKINQGKAIPFFTRCMCHFVAKICFAL